MNNANINASGVNIGANTLTTKEQDHAKNLLDAVEQRPSATQAYYADAVCARRRSQTAYIKNVT